MFHIYSMSQHYKIKVKQKQGCGISFLEYIWLYDGLTVCKQAYEDDL